MSKPIPGEQYLIREGDTSKTIAQRAYGTDFYESELLNANQTFNPGDTINVPVVDPKKSRSNSPTQKDADDFTVLINGKELHPISASVHRDLNSAAYGFSAEWPWTIGRMPDIDEALKPYKYPQVEAFIGPTRVFTGAVYQVDRRLTASGRSITLTGYSYTADAVDSTVKPPYEKNDITLEARAAELIGPIGISLKVESSTGGKFDRVTCAPTDTIFNHITQLATQRGLLVTTNPNSEMVLRKGSISKYLGTVKEGDGLVMDWAGAFDGRKRFNAYRSIGQSPGYNARPKVAIDSVVPRTRFLTFQMDETTKGDIKNGAEWKRSKALGDSLGLSLPVNSFYAPSGDVWQENAGITVISETFGVPGGYTFLIKSVTYNYGPDGKTAEIEIVPPEVYTGAKIVDPWG